MNRRFDKHKILSLTVLSIMLIGSGLLSSCFKFDSDPALEVKVVDQLNNPVSGALVGLFDSQKEWGMLENPIQVWKKTENNGTVTFVGLPEKEIFIWAEFGSFNNLKNEIRTQSILKKNEILQLTIHID